jgi:phosphatidylserine/phosphatidylglycerophosphate/cardiolipin synthase-like enzyme
LALELATSFAAIAHYRQHVHQDATEVQVVLTRPALSAALDAELTEMGWRIASTEHTDQAFMALVQRARQRVVVMTPFLDEPGAEWLKALLSPLPKQIDLTLVLRGLEDPLRWDYPRGYPLLRDWLRQRSGTVLNYSLPHGLGSRRETFHAKLILTDSDIVYVGSANLTAASLEHSMEMGVVLKGRAAAAISDVIVAVMNSADPWPL